MVMAYVVSLLLLALSGVLLDMHRRVWRAAQHDTSLPARDRRFAQAQYRRRMQSSAIIGALGAAIGIWPLVPREPWPVALYVASLAGACLCITLLAALDAWATRQNYARLHSEHLAAQIKLARELSRESHE